MRFDDFVMALKEAGWRPVDDAQYNHLRLLWTKLWPVLAQVEYELSGAERLIAKLMRNK